MPMNPYASFLGDRDSLEVIRATPARIESLITQRGQETLNRTPAPGKWSVREILSHLADCEIVFAFRLRQALAEDHHVIQPFDQDAWAATYSQNDAVIAQVVFAAVRQWNVALIQGMSAADLTRTLNHPERGEMTVKVVVATMAGHDINHLGQIEKILA
jgi:uncharacterized damage-inducible protein DinB